ncbi:MAG: alpha-L-fucosidase [Bacteroidales bacterium]|nr:alpha-L-fucosidase [Bacteroidales bacterium]
MKRLVITLLALTLCAGAFAQWQIDSRDYRISKSDLKRAQELLALGSPRGTQTGPLPDAASLAGTAGLVFPNPAPGAQWFPSASLGLFLHWGIHSMIGAQPSWNMIKGYKWGGDYHSRQEYYDQANHFKPGNYFEKYLSAAREAGFKYAVLTTRHHDGYALWPSRYGIGVKQYLGGRDLVREYVDACHKTGMRVGFYFSPQDWHYPGYRPDTEWDVDTWGKRGPVQDNVQNRKDFEKFFAYVIAQLEELLTNYGRVDVLWLDGMGWYGIPVQDLCTEQVYAWIRSLQPDIVINDRWGNIVNPDNPAGTSMRIGDFTTPFECQTPTYVPSEWWEHCHIWTGKGGGWGYNTKGLFRPLSWFMEEFVASRSLGGNFLPNVGPSGTGDMHPNFYKEIAGLKEWMATGEESLIGCGPTPGVERANVPLTTRGADIWYAHLLGGFKGQVSIKTDRAPVSVVLLRNRQKVEYIYRDGFLNFKLPDSMREGIDDVVKIYFSANPTELDPVRDAAKIKAKKLICFDLDATLTEHRMPLEPAARELLEKLSEKYDLVMSAAGNCPRVYKQMGNFPVPIVGNYGMQESAIVDGEFKIIREDTCPADTAFIMKWCQYFRDKYGYTSYSGDPVEFHASGMVTFGLMGTAPDKYEKLKFDPDKAKRRAMYPEVLEVFKDYAVYIGGSTSFDLTPRQYNKFDATLRYAHEHGYSLDDCLFVGDDLDDGGGDSHIRLYGMDYIRIYDYSKTPEMLRFMWE